MNYSVKYTSHFKSDLKTVLKRGCDLHLLLQIVIDLVAGKILAAKYRDHALKGN